jgi:hypothetical protein
LDTSVLQFLQKFQQKCLLDNVNLSFGILPDNIFAPALTHLLPLLDGIVSLELYESSQLSNIYHAGNGTEFANLAMEMMEKTRFLGAR